QVQEAATKKVERDWIIGRGYDDFKLTEKRHPSRWDIDEAAPKHPVVITRMCGHVIAVNSRVLELAGISKDSKDPEGGRFDRDPDSKEPNGVIRGNAQELIWKVVPPPSTEQLRKGINLAAKELLTRGVTSISEAGVDKATIVQAYQMAIRDDNLPLRVNLMMSANILEDLTKLGIITGFGDERLRIGAIKILADGSTTGRTAALSEPYVDVPETTGIMYISPAELNRQVLIAHKAGFQVGVHAIGDRAISLVLDAIDAALENSPRADHRHRIEHCGINNPTIIKRLKNLDIIPVPQPIFLYGEGESYRAGLGEDRVKWAYPLKSYIEAGITTPMSSDCPATSGAELISPLLGVYVAVTRKTDANKELGPEQRITVEEALRAYTLNSAYATFEEDLKGSIEPGKLADFAVLSDDPLLVQKDEVKDINVEMTFLGGKIVYKKN
ncbi:MAG: amidohydrolase, partial [Candidatus Hodarchaeota archaeon]